MRRVLRRAQAKAATARVGMEGGFWTRSHLDGWVPYDRIQNMLATCQMTLRGPAMMKGTDLSAAGGVGSAQTRTLGELASSGRSADSVRGVSFGVLIATNGKSFTMISNKLDSSAMFRDAEGMILHARAAANIAQNEDLNGDLLLLLVPGREESIRDNQVRSHYCDEPKDESPQ